MRRFGVVAFGLMLTLACANPAEEDPGRSDAGFSDTRDAGRDAGFISPDTGVTDAGSSDAEPRDAGARDAGTTDAEAMDATPLDGGPRTGPLTIVFEPGSAFDRAGTAVFNDSSGAHRLTRTTTVGTIVETVEEGWMVSIIRDVESSSELWTVTDVAPNETYRVAAYPFFEEVAVMSFGTGGPYAGASSYWRETGCGGGGFGTDPNEIEMIGLTDECVSASDTLDYVVLARDAALERLAFKLVEDEPVVDGATVTIADPWRTDFAEIPVDFSNAPTDAVRINVGAVVQSNGGRYDYDADNVFLANGAGQYTIVRPPFGEGIDIRYGLASADNSSVLMITASPAGPQTYDLGADFLAFPETPTMTASPIVGRPTARWTAEPGLDFIELTVLSFAQNIRWKVFLRGDATSFRYPDMPAELDRFEVQDVGECYTGMRTVEADAIVDYAEARAVVGGSVVSWEERLDFRAQVAGAHVRIAGRDLDFK